MNYNKLLSPHELSLRTRRAIFSVMQKYELEPTLTKKYGLLDRIVRGYLHASENNARYRWPLDDLPDGGMQEFHIVADVVSSRDIVKRGATEYKNKRKWMRPYKIGARFDYVGQEKGNKVYELAEIGGRYEFTLRGRLELIDAHTCEDSLFQSGLKGIPTACYHTCAVRCVVPEQLNKAVEESPVNAKIKFTGGYTPMDDLIVDLYKEMEHHRLEAWQRLNILYACARGELKLFEFGAGFRKSVEGFLKEPIAQIQPPVH